jgi:hypothetical protein
MFCINFIRKLLSKKSLLQYLHIDRKSNEDLEHTSLFLNMLIVGIILL